MRTTLTLDDDVAARLQAEARRSGRPFRTVVNEHLRASLARQKTLRTSPPFLVKPRSLGGPAPGVSYDNIGSLLEEIEGARRG
jgi:hypothetical protein